MDIQSAINLAEQKLEGKRYGNEIVSRCPFCESPKHKFYLNVNTGQYSCKRASCNASGNLISLFQKLGINEHIDYEGFELSHKKEATFDLSKLDNLRPVEETDDMVAYMMSRGISYETLVEANVMYRPDKNALAFVTDTGGNVCGVVYRASDKRLFMESGSIQRLYGLDTADLSQDTLYITEGRVDMLTLREMGITNSVSVPNGAASMDWIDRDWDTLQKFKKLVLCYDNDEAGNIAINQAKIRLDFAQLYMLELNGKDINEEFMNDCENLFKTVRNPKEIFMDGFISLKDTKTTTNPLERTGSFGLKQFDYIFGGARLFETTLIVASSGAGKTTVMSNLIAGFRREGEKTAAWSGELPNSVFKTWVYSAIAGEDAVERTANPYREGDFMTSIKPEYEKKIDDYLDGYFYVYDGNKNNGFDMLNHFIQLHKRHGVTNFIIDNGSILDMSMKGLQKYDAEEAFSKELASFARNYPIRLFIVMHPTKTTINADPNFIDGKGRVKRPERYDQYQVRGSASIPNLAHNILFLLRANEHIKAWHCQLKERKLMKENRESEVPIEMEKIQKELSLVAYLAKNRGAGYVNEDALFGYDHSSRRIYGLDTKEEDLSNAIELQDDNNSYEETFDIEDF